MKCQRIVLTALALLVSATPPAQAQQSCEIIPELIFKFKSAQIGTYNAWDSIFGAQDRQERFVSGVGEGNTTIAVGERRLEDGTPASLIIAGLERKGRTIWEAEHEVPGLRDVVKMFPTQSGYMVAGNKSGTDGRGVIWFGFLDKEGKITAQKTVAMSGGELTLHDITPAQGGVGYMLAASFKGAKNGYGLVYKVSAQGEVIKRSAFLPDIESRILTVRAIGAKDYIAAGYVVAEDGRKSGWIMRLEEDGNIRWQRQYPRGAGAEIRTAAGFLNGHVVTGGIAYPIAATGVNNSGWVMAVDGNTGEIIWQRYYSGDVDYEARDILARRDGLIAVLLEAEPVEREGSDYVRLLTINPRGDLMSGDEYFNGEAADAFQMITGGGGDLVLMGQTQMKYTVEGVADAQDASAEEQVIRSQDAWAVAPAPIEPYNDPCME